MTARTTMKAAMDIIQRSGGRGGCDTNAEKRVILRIKHKQPYVEGAK